MYMNFAIKLRKLSVYFPLPPTADFGKIILATTVKLSI